MGWSKGEDWRADATYAAMVVKVRNRSTLLEDKNAILDPPSGLPSPLQPIMGYLPHSKILHASKFITLLSYGNIFHTITSFKLSTTSLVF